MTRRPPRSTLFPSTPLFRSHALKNALIPTVTVMGLQVGFLIGGAIVVETLFAMPGLGTFGIANSVSTTMAPPMRKPTDRKSTRLNSSHGYISYAVFCLKKKK